MTGAMHLVLVIEDDAAIRGVLRALLESEGFRVAEAGGAVRGLLDARAQRPDLLLVDLGLPDGDGVTVIRRLREWSPVPILVLSARTSEPQKLAAFEAGADDYVTKPFSPPELLARVRAALRRGAQGSQSGHEIALGDTRIDVSRRHARNAAGEIHLTPLEYRVLECLNRQAGLIVTQRQLLKEVWGPNHLEDSRGLRVCIKNLRSKLEPQPQRPVYIVTEPGLGYRLRLNE
ncbi:MAG: response regulator [Proteobacteria bacterium]|nr:response regulator [Pseudomonadota bacterium]